MYYIIYFRIKNKQIPKQTCSESSNEINCHLSEPHGYIDSSVDTDQEYI